jgi:hypothetical protein
MKKIKYVIAFIACFTFINGLFAQDIIYKKDKTEIQAKVLEIGVSEIKYKDYDNLNGPTIAIRKDEVIRIKYENGKIQVLTPDIYRANQESAILDKTQAAKFELFSPLTGNLTFCYERMLKVGTNLDFKIGIIGPGLGVADNIGSGVFVKAGPKFLVGQDFVIPGMRYAHPLKGKYIKPEIIFSSFKIKNYPYYNNSTHSYEETDVRSNSLAINIVFGRQWVLGNIMTLDIYSGIGYGLFCDTKADDSNASGETFFEGYQYSHLYMGKNFPLALSAGFTVGIIF